MCAICCYNFGMYIHMLFPLFTTDPKYMNISTRSNLISDAKSHKDGNIFGGKILPKSQHENNLENKHLRLLIFHQRHKKKETSKKLQQNLFLITYSAKVNFNTNSCCTPLLRNNCCYFTNKTNIKIKINNKSVYCYLKYIQGVSRL